VRAFFALGRRQPRAEEGSFPILAYNPHPYAVRGIWECELNLPEPSREPEISLPRVRFEGQPLPCQLEKESSNLSLDWRKRVVFAAELPPGRMSRFDCSFYKGQAAPPSQPSGEGEEWIFRNPEREVRVNSRTGLLDAYLCGGVPFLAPGAFRPLVLRDDGDPWGMRVRGFGEVIGEFRLASPQEGTALSGACEQTFDSLRVVEDGEVRTVVEAVLTFGRSHLCLQYALPKRGRQIEIRLRVHWNEKNRMLKLAVPTLLKDARCLGQAPFGVTPLEAGGQENVCQRWIAVASREQGLALTCINDGTYGSDFREGELRLSLLRSPAYAAHPFKGRPFLEHRRYLPRIDQGERCFRFWLCGGAEQERLEAVDREAMGQGEKPFMLCCFPAGSSRDEDPLPVVELSDGIAQMSCLGPLPGRRRGLYLIRLYEPTGFPRSTEIRLPALGIRRALQLGGFEVKTLLLSKRRRALRETDLLGER
jgi:alpha-mannosidase